MTGNMDEPIQDSREDPAKDVAEETQYVSVEIDTQATDGFDDAFLANEAFKQISDVAPRAPSASKPEPRYTVPLEQGEPMDFKFAKPAHKIPIFRPTKPSADSTTVPPHSILSSGSQGESYSNNSTNGALTTGGEKEFSEPAIGNEDEPVAEPGTAHRPALKQKDPNAPCSTSISARQQKRGVSFASGPINNGRPLIQSLMPQKSQFTSTPLPFADIQPQAKKRRTTAIAKTLQEQSLVSSQKESHLNQHSTTQSGSISLPFEDQTHVQKGLLQLKEAASLRADVDDRFNVAHVSDQYAPLTGHGPPFGPISDTRANSPTPSSSSDYKPLSSHMGPKSAANQARRTSICSKDNDWIGKLPAANMPFPDVTYPVHSHPNNGQRMHKVGRQTLSNRPGTGYKKNSQAAGPRVNLQAKPHINPEWSLEGIDVKDWADGCGYTTQQRECASYSGETNNLSNELHQSIEVYLEKGKQSLFEQIQQKDAKINEISEKNKYYKENISELTRTNASLSGGLSTVREKADALKERVKSQFEECKSLGEFVVKHKSETAELRRELEDMRTSLVEARNGLEGLEIHQQNSKAGLKEAMSLAKSQIRSFESLQGKLEMYRVQIQQERDRSKLLQKEIQAHHQERGLKVIVKDIFDSHKLSITDRLAIHEGKLSEAIRNAEKENQSRLSECLKLLESTTEKSPQTPKEVLEIKSLIETLSTSINDRLQSADDGSEDLRNAGTEVMEELKARVETLFEVQDAQKELEEQISTLRVTNARLEVAIQGHEERVLDLQSQLTAKEREIDKCRTESNQKSEWNRTQFDNGQKELDKCQRDLSTRDDELQKAQVMIEAGSVAQIELTILQEAHTKAVIDLAEATKNLADCQAALAERDAMASTMKAQNTNLEERLSSVQQKTIDVEQELSRFKASASESLKRHRVEAETYREKSVESERRTHVQKVSNLQRLRAEAEAMLEELKTETQTIKEDVKKKEQSIQALEADKATLEEENKEQAERLAQLEQGSTSQPADLRLMAEDLKWNTLSIARVDKELARNEENAAAVSRIHKALISEHTVVKSRLELYERVEAKAQEFCRKSGISFDGDAGDAVLQILAGFEDRKGVVARIPSRGNGVGNRTAESHTHNGQASSFISTGIRRQAPKSPEIPDSQMPPALSYSPVPRQEVRSIAPQRNSALYKAALPPRGLSEEIARGPATEVARSRESRNIKDTEDDYIGSPFFKREIEDSQVTGSKRARAPSYSPLSERNPDDIDQFSDCFKAPSNHPEDRKEESEKSARGQRPAESPKMADLKPSKAGTHKSAPILQAKTPLKGCLKKTTSKNDMVDDKTMSNDTVKTSLSHPTPIKQSPSSRQASVARLASIPNAHDQSKKTPSNNDLGRNTLKLDSKQPITSMQPGSSVSRLNARKRPITSVSGGMGSESTAKQPRLSIPGREFQAVAPFIPEEKKRRSSSRLSQQLPH